MFKGIFKNALRALRRELAHKLELDKNPLERKSLPYRLWAALPKRKAAKAAPTRQCIRKTFTTAAFLAISEMYPSEPRAARRRMARSMAKAQWREKRGLVAA